MFIQQPVTSTEQLIKSSEDFDLVITSKSKEDLKGKIRFQYLQQQFEANLFISPSTIKIQSQYPFSGIESSAHILALNKIQTDQYVQNGSLTKLGHQNILWLILDIIHLYNVLRLKPATILDLYRDAFSFAKALDNELIFGNIKSDNPIANNTANYLGQKMKKKHKYAYGNNLDLLKSIQHILANYPQDFLQPKTVLNNLNPVLS